LNQTSPYTVLILKAGPRYSAPGPDRDPEVASAIWKHGKRNMSLRVAGLMPLICPIADGSGYAGVSVMTVMPDEAAEIMAADPAVQAGVLIYETHATRSFPESSLPAASQ
jgi:hypothetical protein